jgi:hypothetical protein
VHLLNMLQKLPLYFSQMPHRTSVLLFRDWKHSVVVPHFRAKPQILAPQSGNPVPWRKSTVE